MIRLTAVLALATALLSSSSGAAGAPAPQPVRSVPPSMYTGRWYQIGQIVTTNHHPCPAGTDDFQPGVAGGFMVVMSCHDPSGMVRQMKAKGVVEPNSGGAKFRIGFLGGLIHQDYWILDRAPDGSWALMATPGGNYLWLLARRPALDAAAHAAAVARIEALGYNAARLASDR